MATKYHYELDDLYANTGVNSDITEMIGLVDGGIPIAKVANGSRIEEITTIDSSATPTPTGGSARNFLTVTALAEDATFAAASGTMASGNRLITRIKDDGTIRTLAWNPQYRAVGVALPNTTVAGKTLYCGFIWNSADSKFDLVASSQEA